MWRNKNKGFRHKGPKASGKGIKGLKPAKLQNKSKVPGAGPMPRNSSIGTTTNVWRKPTKKGFRGHGK